MHFVYVLRSTVSLGGGIIVHFVCVLPFVCIFTWCALAWPPLGAICMHFYMVYTRLGSPEAHFECSVVPEVLCQRLCAEYVSCVGCAVFSDAWNKRHGRYNGILVGNPAVQSCPRSCANGFALLAITTRFSIGSH